MKNKNNIIPLVTYNNMDINKSIIYKENRGKSGIYRLNNIITGKSYIGSSVSLARRFSNYYSLGYLKNHTKNGFSFLNNSLLKYGYSNFSIDILEYCESSLCISREQYYLDLLKPEYNICPIAGSRLGSKQSEETKAKIRANNLGKRHTPEIRQKIGLSIKLSVKDNFRSKTVTNETRLKISSRCNGINIKAYDKSNNLVNQYSSIKNAAKHLGVSDRTIANNLNTGKSYDGYIYKSEIVVGNSVMIFNKKNNTIKEYYSIRSVAIDIGVSTWSIYKYINTNKLLKNIYLISNKNFFK